MVFYGPDNSQVDNLILFLFNSFMGLSHFKEKGFSNLYKRPFSIELGI